MRRASGSSPRPQGHGEEPKGIIVNRKRMCLCYEPNTPFSDSWSSCTGASKKPKHIFFESPLFTIFHANTPDGERFLQVLNGRFLPFALISSVSPQNSSNIHAIYYQALVDGLRAGLDTDACGTLGELFDRRIGVAKPAEREGLHERAGAELGAVGTFGIVQCGIGLLCRSGQYCLHGLADLWYRAHRKLLGLSGCLTTP